MTRISLSLLSFALLLVSARPDIAAAAPGDHVFSQGYGVDGIATVDSTGAITAVGTFFGSVDFGGGTLSSVGFLTPDVFVAHFDASGGHLWSAAFDHDNGFGGVSVADITADASGDVYVTGRIFDGDIDFGGGLLAGPNESFIVKFDSAGVHQWSATYGDGTPTAIASSSAGIALTGHTSASVDFGGGAIATAGARDVFYAVLDSAGSHLRSAGYGDAGNDQIGADVTIDSAGNVTIAGGMSGTVDFGGGPIGAAASDMFLASFDSSGTHQWSQFVSGSYAGGSSVVSVKPRLALGPSGTPVTVAGEMRGAIDFGGGLLSSNGQADIYVATYDPATGAHLSSLNIGGSTSEIVESLSVDPTGASVITGTMFGSFDAGGGTLTYVGSSDFFVVSLDASGNHLWSNSFGTAGSEYLAGSSVASNTGSVLLWGGGGSGIDFGGGALGSASLFLVGLEGKAAIAVPSAGTLALSLLAVALVGFGIARLETKRP